MINFNEELVKLVEDRFMDDYPFINVDYLKAISSNEIYYSWGYDSVVSNSNVRELIGVITSSHYIATAHFMSSATKLRSQLLCNARKNLDLIRTIILNRSEKDANQRGS